MNYLSVCSGVEAATVAWHPLGWNAVGYAEIEPFPSAVLAHHYPTVPNLGDMTKYKEWDIGTNRLDLLVGGTPCQAFSVAGLRQGLADPRGNLTLIYTGILDHYKPKWFVWENVPGVLSSNGGRDFGSFLGAVAELGYGFAYRVLDAQYFRGTPQRRRRVFVVGHLGNWELAAKTLFEQDCLSRHLETSRNKGKVTSTIVTGSAGGNHQERVTFNRQSHSQYGTDPLASTVKARDHKQFTDLVVYETHPADSRVKEMGDVCQTVTSRWGTGGGNVPIAIQDVSGRDKAQNGRGWSDENVMYTLDRASTQGVAYSIREDAKANNFSATELEVTPALQALRPSVQSHHAQTFIAQAYDPLYNQGITQGELNASTQEGNSVALLRELQEKVGEEAFTKWGLGILNTLQSKEILQQALYGDSIRPATFSRSWVVYCALSCEKDDPSWLLQSLRETECIGCPPQGWQPSKQFVGELGAYLSELSQSGAQAKRFMHDLWKSSERSGLLRETLSKVQEMGRPSNGEGESIRRIMSVRRLTAEECEFLQGFPRGYTNIPWRGKSESPDSLRYKAMGNSMAVPCMNWIGQRIQQVEDGLV